MDLNKELKFCLQQFSGGGQGVDVSEKIEVNVEIQKKNRGGVRLKFLYNIKKIKKCGGGREAIF